MSKIPKNAPLTPEQREEMEREDAEVEQMVREIESGISPCCKAPLDESRVITEGRYKGHGHRYCSLCKKWVFTR